MEEDEKKTRRSANFIAYRANKSNSERKERMKKTTVRSITIGSIALIAATAGAWLMLTSEPQKKEVNLSSPSSSGKMHQQASTEFDRFDLDDSPAKQTINPADEKQEVISDPMDYPSENLLKNATKKKTRGGF